MQGICQAGGTVFNALSGKTEQWKRGALTTVIHGDQPNGSPWKAEYIERTDDGWNVRIVWVEDRGHAVVSEITIRPRSLKSIPAGGLTARRLQRLRHNAKLDVLKRVAVSHFSRDPRARRDFAPLLGADPTRRGGRSPLYEERFYAQLAIDYEEATRVSRKPILDLAKKYNLSPNRVRALVHESRGRKYLTKANPGRAGGRATARARSLTARR
jgi:hypothetical protein